MTPAHIAALALSLATPLATCDLAETELGETIVVSERARESDLPSELPHQRREPSDTLLYKVVGDVELSLSVYKPDDWSPSDERPAVIFYFGGGWNSGNWDHFRPQATYFASRGLVTITPNYRVRSRNGTPAIAATQDARDAYRFVHAHADILGIDPDRIAVGGGSAGGHLAACVAAIDTVAGDPPRDPEGEPSLEPAAMLLYNPVLDTVDTRFSGGAMLGVLGDEISPLHHAGPTDPPAFIIHGDADDIVSVDDAHAFAARLRDAGVRCELAVYPGRGHGFFNRGRGDGLDFTDTLARADRFLDSLGLIPTEPAPSHAD